MSQFDALGTFTEGTGPRGPGVVCDGKVIALASLLADAPVERCVAEPRPPRSIAPGASR